mmetsp:Transcript_15314/g.19667  ORF Transcript_15314/g.19667 Transcript_15314/m.19667 type:complete len:232 (+) Transcript_15314:207-902(+)
MTIGIKSFPSLSHHHSISADDIHLTQHLLYTSSFLLLLQTHFPKHALPLFLTGNFSRLRRPHAKIHIRRLLHLQTPHHRLGHAAPAAIPIVRPIPVRGREHGPDARPALYVPSCQRHAPHIAIEQQLPRDDIVLRQFIERIVEVLRINVPLSARAALEGAGANDRPIGAHGLHGALDVRLVRRVRCPIGIVPNLRVRCLFRRRDQEPHAGSVEIAAHCHDSFHLLAFVRVE